MAIGGNITDVHADRLKMYLPHVDGSKIALHFYKPHRAVPEDDSLVVERITGHRTRNGERQWKVRWKGYDADFDSWEPASSFIGHIQKDWIAYNRRRHLTIPLDSMME